ncbi:unnamed protein product [Amoebophrya sp. A120]|nr:unnamed protein product [Amoebophrya sp. A120]|eukprot:GSA120T00012775001.1
MLPLVFEHHIQFSDHAFSFIPECSAWRSLSDRAQKFLYWSLFCLSSFGSGSYIFFDSTHSRRAGQVFKTIFTHEITISILDQEQPRDKKNQVAGPGQHHDSSHEILAGMIHQLAATTAVAAGSLLSACLVTVYDCQTGDTVAFEVSPSATTSASVQSLKWHLTRSADFGPFPLRMLDLYAEGEQDLERHSPGGERAFPSQGTANTCPATCAGGSEQRHDQFGADPFAFATSSSTTRAAESSRNDARTSTSTSGGTSTSGSPTCAALDDTHLLCPNPRSRWRQSQVRGGTSSRPFVPEETTVVPPWREVHNQAKNALGLFVNAEEKSNYNSLPVVSRARYRLTRKSYAAPSFPMLLGHYIRDELLAWTLLSPCEATGGRIVLEQPPILLPASSREGITVPEDKQQDLRSNQNAVSSGFLQQARVPSAEGSLEQRGLVLVDSATTTEASRTTNRPAAGSAPAGRVWLQRCEANAVLSRIEDGTSSRVKASLNPSDGPLLMSPAAAMEQRSDRALRAVFFLLDVLQHIETLQPLRLLALQRLPQVLGLIGGRTTVRGRVAQEAAWGSLLQLLVQNAPANGALRNEILATLTWLARTTEEKSLLRELQRTLPSTSRRSSSGVGDRKVP